jgi:hypothetical protein
MATLIIVIGVALLLVILGGAVLVVTVSTRERSGSRFRLPGFGRFETTDGDGPPAPLQ